MPNSPCGNLLWEAHGMRILAGDERLMVLVFLALRAFDFDFADCVFGSGLQDSGLGFGAAA